MGNRPAGHPTIAAAYAALTEALGTMTPACEGDNRFTDDTTDAATLAPVCHGCRVFAQCRDLALSSPYGPVWGVLAGYTRRGNSPATLTRSA